MNEFKQTIVGKEIKRIRKEKNLKLNELAERIGISDRHLRRIENSDQVLSVDLIKKIANALEVSDVYLYVLISGNFSSISQEKLIILENIIESTIS